MESDSLLYKALDEYAKQEAKSIGKEIGNRTVEFSDRFKRKMNRVFREQMGAKKALHPEVDNLYERIRSFIVRKWLLAKRKG